MTQIPATPAAAVTPDQLNDLLAQPALDVPEVIEAAARRLTAAVDAAGRGPELDAALLGWALAREAELRARFAADEPVVRWLDEYHAGLRTTGA